MSEDPEPKQAMPPTPPTEPPSAPPPAPPLLPMTSGSPQGDALKKDESSITPPEREPNSPPLIGLRPVLPDTPGVRSFMAGALHNAWKCPNGHILGIVLQEQRSGRRITRLGLLPFAFEAREFIPENIIVSKIDAGEIACSRCGLVRIWHPSEWLTNALIGKLRRS